MAALKHPCVGDLTYGADPTLARARGSRAAVAARGPARASSTPAPGSTSSTSRATPRTWSVPSRSSAMPTDRPTGPAPSRPRSSSGRARRATSPRVHDVFVAASAASRPPAGDALAGRGARLGRVGLLDRPGRAVGGRPRRRGPRLPPAARSWLNLLFVHPDRPARGVGAALLDLVKALRPQGFGLRVYQANTRARDFYRRHGLVELEAHRRQQLPRRRARPPDGVAGRGAARLPARPHRRGRRRARGAAGPAGGAHRCCCRTTRRSAATPGAIPSARPRSSHGWRVHVPGLGRRRIAAVMHTVIAESLAAWEERSS